MTINNITIIGSGNLGTRIGLQAAVSGYRVTFFDLNEKAFESSRTTIAKILKYLVHSNKISKSEISEINARMRFTTILSDAVQDADLISESVTEDLIIKQKAWTEIGTLAPANTIFTTNTSYLLPSQLAHYSGRPEKFCAFHFHDVFYSRIVDIMPHAGTDPALIPLLEEVGKKLNQVPVLVKKETPGYIFNSMLMAVIGEAARLLTQELASIHYIDKSWMVNFNMPAGPFGIMDNIGLDTAWHVVKERKDVNSIAFASMLKTYIDQGKLGEKSGEGFYKYPDPEYKREEFER